jgi:hypothetical protein
VNGSNKERTMGNHTALIEAELDATKIQLNKWTSWLLPVGLAR